MKKRKMLALDPCKVKIPRLKKLGAEALFSIGHRIRQGTTPKSFAMRKLAAWADNYGAAKIARRAHGDAKTRRDAVRGYLIIARRLEAQFKAARSKACVW